MKILEEENSDFLAKWLDNQLDEQIKSDFENSDEGKEFMKLIQASDNLALTPFNVDLAFDQFKSNNSEAATQKISIFRRPIVKLAIAASILALLVMTFLMNQNDYTIVTTVVGQNQEVPLPDGSVIRLNANSELKYEADNWGEERRILLDGEAFFEVQRGNDFTVETSEGNIKVLGTSFNVRVRGELLDVVCYTGKVKVSNGSTFNTDLTPGLSVKIEDDKVFSRANQEIIDFPGWIRGVTELDNVTFKETLNELKHHFTLNIENDGSFDDERIKVTFPNNNAELSISLVMKALNIRYTFDASANALVILGKN